VRRTAAIVFLVLAACGTPKGRQVWQAIGANLDAIPGCRAAEDMTTGQAREQVAALNAALVNAYAEQSRGQLDADARANLTETVAAYRVYVASLG
jgi:hypothetical protein